MIWVAESRQPDGTWRELFRNGTVKVAISWVRHWRRDQGHLATETRVRSV